MRIDSLIAVGAALQTAVSAVAIPETSDLTSSLDATPQHQQRDFDDSLYTDLWKRRGGGSGGRGGGSSGSGSSGSSSSSGSGSGSSSSGSSSGSSSSSGKTGSSGSSSSSSGSSSGSSGGRGAASSSSSTGGRTTTGSGAAPAYGGGRFYGGGTTVPYRAGSRSTGGIVPFVLVGGLAAYAFWPGVWYHPPYMYPYAHPWNYHNQSSNQNETKPVTCACDPYQVCGCDDNANQTYIDSVVGNGSYNSLNRSLVAIGDVNGTETILINGTLPNGTTASGGTDSPNAAAGLRHLAQAAGWWPLVATAAAMAFFA
ncbi:hypothetical protein INS49_002729 [Diaporthe citri]|uniref:uncharacterized protein n=1 Tax=Diaporthe citri TaxID=83186 RepID=UPI001C81F8B3|nr:uncharacterized protein INS49_002729 [Diaporthe citri]KAG6368519.1 hypothetical protein INS49_002729 [Diaporthe citri]